MYIKRRYPYYCAIIINKEIPPLAGQKRVLSAVADMDSEDASVSELDSSF